MKKILVIGCPGSGKSTFAKALHAITGIPLVHLDLLYWNADQTTVSKDVFLDRLQHAMQADGWIIDGNYASTMEQRIRQCDTVIFLDYPTQVCLDGVVSRKGKKRSDMPFITTEDDEEFLTFIKNYRSQHRPQVLSLLETYADKQIVVLTSREQADEFLAKCKREYAEKRTVTER